MVIAQSTGFRTSFDQQAQQSKDTYTSGAGIAFSSLCNDASGAVVVLL